VKIWRKKCGKKENKERIKARKKKGKERKTCIDKVSTTDSRDV
jgi:hypothetical protein